MGPQSKEAIVRAMGHIIDELVQQREVGRKTLEEVRKLARRLETQEEDHDALEARVTALRAAGNGNANGRRP
jgi:hypothetical protein